MQTDKILQADVLDIIFENRNKNYGAYTLRKYYNKRLYKALGAMLLFVSILYSFSFIPGKSKVILNIGPEILIKDISPIHDKPDPKQPEKPKEAVVKQKVNSQQFTNKIVVVKGGVTVPKINTINDSTEISNTTETGEKSGTTAIIANTGTGSGDKTGTAEVKPVDKITPMATAEIMPAYPGGIEALRKFLQKNLRNPEDLEDGQVVSVKIKFIVGYDGALKGFETVEDGGTAFNNEVVRVLKKMPGWIPGKSRGENVSVYYTIPVKFVAE